MAKFAAGAWCVCLFIGTCTANFDSFILYQRIQFIFHSHPDWEELFILTNIFSSKSMLIQKIRHFCGFFILSLLLNYRSNNKTGLYLSIGYAVLTEILQLYFGRDGRIGDVFIDSAGIFIAYAIILSVNRRIITT